MFRINKQYFNKNSLVYFVQVLYDGKFYPPYVVKNNSK